MFSRPRALCTRARSDFPSAVAAAWAVVAFAKAVSAPVWMETMPTVMVSTSISAVVVVALVEARSVVFWAAVVLLEAMVIC
jgi:hypothetical protein